MKCSQFTKPLISESQVMKENEDWSYRIPSSSTSLSIHCTFIINHSFDIENFQYQTKKSFPEEKYFSINGTSDHENIGRKHNAVSFISSESKGSINNFNLKRINI